MNSLKFVIAALAVWRLTHLLNTEDGPQEIFARCRNWLRRISLGGLADCFYCLSMWVAAPFAVYLGTLWQERVTLWLALSGAAILINRLAQEPLQAAVFHEEPYKEEESSCNVAEMEEGREFKPRRQTQVRSA